MSNGEIYRKTLVFSVRRLLYDILAFVILGAAGIIGFFIAEKTMNRGLVGLVIGLVAGLIILVIFLRYVSFTYKAGQIAMMTRGVTEGDLPDNVLAEGKKVVRERFATVAAYFAVTGIIKGVFNEIGRGISGIGKAVGGEKGETVGSVISTVIQTVVAYLCDCCLGWVFFRAGVKAFKATCEGAVIFFKHGKTLAKNMGRVFGMGLVSLIIIGGAFTGVFYVIFSRFPSWFEYLSAELSEVGTRLSTEFPDIINNPGNLMIACAVLAAVILWSILHSVFVRPFVLVGVLRNYMASGMNDIPSEDSFSVLDGKSKQFAKLRAKMAAE